MLVVAGIYQLKPQIYRSLAQSYGHVLVFSAKHIWSSFSVISPIIATTNNSDIIAKARRLKKRMVTLRNACTLESARQLLLFGAWFARWRERVGEC